MTKIEKMLEELTPIKRKDKEKVETSFKVIGSPESPFAFHSSSESESIASMETETSNISKIENAFRNLELKSNPKVKRLTNKVVGNF